jgi:uncharacterized protein with PQ loop repeat
MTSVTMLARRNFVLDLGFAAASYQDVANERSTKDFSLSMPIVVILDAALWLIYGRAAGRPPLIASNAIGIAFVSVILYHKVRYG